MSCSKLGFSFTVNLNLTGVCHTLSIRAYLISLRFLCAGNVFCHPVTVCDIDLWMDIKKLKCLNAKINNGSGETAACTSSVTGKT